MRLRVIAGSAKGRPLKSVRGREIRPTSDRVKESLFNVIGTRVMDAKFLDLFAGSGNVGIEALSRGAANCLFVELITQHLRVLEENLLKTRLRDGAELMRRDARAALQDLGQRGRRFDLIFVDPPYGLGLVTQALESISDHGLLDQHGWVMCEHHKKDLVPDAVPKAELAGGLNKFRELIFGETVVSLYSETILATGGQSV